MKHGESVQSRILVVDDNQVIALTLGAILEEAGYEVASAFSGEEAIERAEAFLPKLLLSDISMRPMNGIEAAVQITAKLPDCRVLFLSGNPSIADCSEAPPGTPRIQFPIETDSSTRSAERDRMYAAGQGCTRRGGCLGNRTWVQKDGPARFASDGETRLATPDAGQRNRL